MARDVAPVAGALVPVEVAHARRTVASRRCRPPRSVLLNALFLDPGVSGGPGDLPARTRAGARPRVPAICAWPSRRTRSGARTLRAEGWERLRRGRSSCPARTVNACDASGPNRYCSLGAHARGRFDVLHSLASIAPVWPGTPLGRDAARRHLSAAAHLRARSRRWAWAGSYGARRHRADVLIASTRRGSRTRSAPCSASTRRASRSFRSRTNAPRPARADRRGASCASAIGWTRRSRRAVCRRQAPSQEPAAAGRGAPGRSQATSSSCSSDTPSSRTSSSCVSSRGRAASRPRMRLLDYVSDEELEGLWRLCLLCRPADARRGFRNTVARGARARSCPLPPATWRCCARSAADLPHYFDPHDPAAAAAAIARGARRHDPTAVLGPPYAARFTLVARRRTVSTRPTNERWSLGECFPGGKRAARPRATHVGLNLIFLVPGETGGMEVAARELIPALLDAGAARHALHGLHQPRGRGGGRRAVGRAAAGRDGPRARAQPRAVGARRADAAAGARAARTASTSSTAWARRPPCAGRSRASSPSTT